MKHAAAHRLAALLAALPAWASPQQPATTSGLPVERHAAAPATAGPVDARAGVDRTALWPGDRVRYTVEIDCAPSYDVLAADMEPDKLPLAGLELVSTDSERSVSSAGRTVHRVRYLLSAYDVAAPALRIGELRVRYYVRRAGQRVEDVVPAGEARLAGLTLALRSTIPDEISAVAARDDRAPAPLPAAARLAGPVGLGLVLLSIAPVGLWAAALAKRAADARRRSRPRHDRRAAQGALEELRGLDATSEAGRRAAYDRLDALLRQKLAEAGSIPAAALTASEIASRLRAARSPLPADEIQGVLEDCERARYGSSGALPDAQRFRAGVAAAEALLTARAR